MTREGTGPSGRLEPLMAEDLCDPSAFFDCLIGQQDRHTGNFRFDPATGLLTLIDHGYSFPGGAWRLNDTALLRERHAQGRAALTPDEHAILDDLPNRDVWQELHAVLRGDQFSALAIRREAMLARGEVLQPSNVDFVP